MRTLFLLLLLPLLAGADKAEPKAAAGTTKIVFVGDSLTEGYQLPGEQSFPVLVGEKLKAAGKQVTIVNAGVSGATSASGLSRLKWHLKGKPKPKVVVLALGANDGLRGQDVENTKKNLKATIDLAQKEGLKVLIAGMQMPPNYGAEYTKNFRQMFFDLAKEEKVDIIPFLLEGVAAIPKYNLPDGIHPNAEGYKIIADTVYKYLAPDGALMHAVLEVTDLDKSYSHAAGTVNVLTGLTCCVGQAETAAILGPSGSGRSTLLAMLAGLDHPDAGEVQLMGRDLTKLSEEELTAFRSQHMGIVFQQFHLMGHLTAQENVALPLDIQGNEEAAKKAATALEDVGLGHRLNHYPHELSGGECQRVAIARAFVAQPALILADEPSGNLDEQTGDQVMQMLFDLVTDKGTTLILVTHNEALAKKCNRRFRLADGKLTEQNPA